MEDVNLREMEDEKMVAEAYQHLIDTYLASHHRKHTEIIDKAFNFAKEAHKGVRRLSGEPYIMHPIAVAQIACEDIGLGSTGICSALLHDVVEDTDYTVEDIANIFGPKIAQIVDGLTKISGGIFGDKASVQAESFKKLLLTMSEDIRVILIKISDRLHNMRTLGSQLPGKQYKIAGETLYIYAPLAHRLGLNKVKEELEDLSFKYEHPEEYKALQDQLEGIREHLTTIFDQFTEPIRQELDKAGIKYEIKARFKKPYSIWSKMQTKHVTFEEVYDILAVRIIFEPTGRMSETDECFQIYNIASTIYKPHPDRLRDWVHNKKANGYQALHSTLMSKSGKWVEVQIRSRRMDDIAEHGFAAHWKYKDGDGNAEGTDDGLDKWLYQIKEILDDPQPNAIDFLDTIKLNLFANEIFVVTPKGEFKTMPAGCTVLDFAFSVHTFLGTHCIGAKVNHKLVGISHILESGDQVEILTSKTQKVEKQWMNYATTAKAMGKIQAILRRMEREKQKVGEDILTEFLQKNEKEATSFNIAKLCRYHALSSREELLSMIGSQTIVLGEGDLAALNEKIEKGTKWSKYFNLFKKRTPSNSPLKGENSEASTSGGGLEGSEADERVVVDKKKPIILSEETIDRYTLCDDCHPIPGDDVLGYIGEDGHIIIHKRQCEVAKRLKATGGNQILAATWDTHGTLSFPATLHIIGFDRVGVLHQITGILSQQLNVNIHSVHIDTSDGLFTAEIRLGVHDAKDIQAICRDLKKIEEVEDVRRF
ncbi:MAG: bifunctional (p)ppGpp synthetase/guanosine-3',5'-bis(diphosphate) 3'-pyrophosphohydrolase [Bacteroidaceae bacterium]|nr:bifunctional (p)ppGpp synthetase/guanosine-3',5'-bis(diphosphate) 3'-pyrophosphohydrolase [Bacteroidaceae bacterium]